MDLRVACSLLALLLSTAAEAGGADLHGGLSLHVAQATPTTRSSERQAVESTARFGPDLGTGLLVRLEGERSWLGLAGAVACSAGLSFREGPGWCGNRSALLGGGLVVPVGALAVQPGISAGVGRFEWRTTVLHPAVDPAAYRTTELLVGPELWLVQTPADVERPVDLALRLSTVLGMPLDDRGIRRTPVARASVDAVLLVGRGR